MRAVSLRDGQLALREVPTPVPGSGQLLVRTLACAICASDHHYMDHPDVSRDDKSGMRVDAPQEDVIMGHEYCAEVVEYGPDTKREWPIGTHVTSPPALFTANGMRIIGMAPEAPGGFGEYFLLTEFLARPVPNDLPVERIAVSDAMAVGWFYTRLGTTGGSSQGTVPLVIGLGAIGMSVIAALKLRGAGPIVACDFSDSRRELALKLGADVVVDPAKESPYAAWRQLAWGSSEEVYDRMALMGRKAQVVYECAGVKGVLTEVVDGCQSGARIYSVGGAHIDEIPSSVAHLKGLEIKWGGGPEVTDWYECLDLVVSGELDPMPIVGGTVSLDELADAIERARSKSAPLRIVFKA